LELSWAWEPLSNSRSSTIGEGKETQFCVSYGNT